MDGTTTRQEVKHDTESIHMQIVGKNGFTSRPEVQKLITILYMPLGVYHCAMYVFVCTVHVYIYTIDVIHSYFNLTL